MSLCLQINNIIHHVRVNATSRVMSDLLPAEMTDPTDSPRGRGGRQRRRKGRGSSGPALSTAWAGSWPTPPLCPILCREDRVTTQLNSSAGGVKSHTSTSQMPAESGCSICLLLLCNKPAAVHFLRVLSQLWLSLDERLKCIYLFSCCQKFFSHQWFVQFVELLSMLNHNFLSIFTGFTDFSKNTFECWLL